MKCPHCNQELPDDYLAVYCNFCGKDLPASPEGGVLPPVKIRWFWFWTAFLAPPLLTMLSAWLTRLAMPPGINEGISPWVALIGSVIGGMACGTIIGLKQGTTISQRVGIGFVCSVALYIVCQLLCFLGCSVGGYQMRFH